MRGTRGGREYRQNCGDVVREGGIHEPEFVRPLDDSIRLLWEGEGTRERDRQRERQTERQRERDRERDREEGGEANLCKMYFTLKTLPYCFANCAFSSLEAITIWPRGDEPAALKVVLELAVL
jgi:hypothetical protein